MLEMRENEDSTAQVIWCFCAIAHLRRNAGHQFCNGMAYYFVYRLLISWTGRFQNAQQIGLQKCIGAQ